MNLRMIKLERIQTDLTALSHTDQCAIEYVGDGLPCNCGYTAAVEGIERLIQAERPTEERAVEQADGFA